MVHQDCLDHTIPGHKKSCSSKYNMVSHINGAFQQGLIFLQAENSQTQEKLLCLDNISEICLGDACGILFYNFKYLTRWQKDKMIILFENDFFWLGFFYYLLTNPIRFFMIFILTDRQLSFLILRRSYDLFMMTHGRICLYEFIRDQGGSHLYSLIK